MTTPTKPPKPKYKAPKPITIRNSAMRDRAKQIIDALPEEPVCVVSFSVMKDTRSLKQNRLYWKWLGILRVHMADSTGEFHAEEDLHEWLMKKFLPLRTIEVAGELVPIRRSTKGLNVEKMAKYMTLVDRHCADSLHLWLPQPGQENE